MSVIHEYRPGLWLIETDLDGYDMKVRGAVICTEKWAVIWDSLTHPRDLQIVLPLLEGKQIAVIYSHADWDHIWGTSAIPKRLLVIGHQFCLDRFNKDVPETLAKMQAKQPGKWDDITLVAPNLVFNRQLSLDLGGVTLKLEHLPGHTEDSIVAYLPEWGILLGGDSIETPLPTSWPQSPIQIWADALENWQNTPGLKTVIPAHGIIGGKDVLHNNTIYLRGLLQGKTVGVIGEMNSYHKEAHQDNLIYHKGKE